MEVKVCDPEELSISELNERKTVQNIKPLVNSIKKQGIIQPPIVRPSNGGLEVVIGQRRVLAAREAGLSEVVCVVAEWNDSEALLSSITENVETFVEDVSRKDRAAAIARLKEDAGMTLEEIGEEIGVGPSTVRKWMERARDEWEGTAVHPEPTLTEAEPEVTEEPQKSGEEKEGDWKESDDAATEVIGANVDPGVPSLVDEDEDIESDEGPKWRGILDRGDRLRERLEKENVLEKLDDESLINIRQMTGGGQSGEEVALKIVRKGLSQKEIREVRKLVDRGEDVFEAVDRVAKGEEEEKVEKAHVSVTFTGETARRLKSLADKKRMTEGELVKELVSTSLGVKSKSESEIPDDLPDLTLVAQS